VRVNPNPARVGDLVGIEWSRDGPSDAIRFVIKGIGPDGLPFKPPLEISGDDLLHQSGSVSFNPSANLQGYDVHVLICGSI
jgi:hypothetical protein